jgi:hypothetical protein
LGEVTAAERQEQTFRTPSVGTRRKGLGVDIGDLRDRSRTLHASWWQWRPAVVLIRSLGLFDGERLDNLTNGFGEFTSAEARQLASALEERVLPGLQPGERVLLDGTVTSEPDVGTFHRTTAEQHRNYSTDYDWLVAFIVFCKDSDGLYVC